MSKMSHFLFLNASVPCSRIGRPCVEGQHFTSEKKKERANCLPWQVSSSERNDKIKTERERGLVDLAQSQT